MHAIGGPVKLAAFHTMGSLTCHNAASAGDPGFIAHGAISGAEKIGTVATDTARQMLRGLPGHERAVPQLSPLQDRLFLFRRTVSQASGTVAQFMAQLSKQMAGGPIMIAPNTDAQLISRIKAGDRAAFGDLVDKYQDHLLRFVARRLPDRSDAEDVAQETLIRAYCAIDDFRGDAKFTTWLFRIGLNMVTDFQAIEARRRAVTSGAGGGWGMPQHWIDGSVDTEDPETLLSTRQLAELLAHAIAGLSPELRSVLLLREFEGLSYAEIARAVHCPVTTVRSRLARARDVLASAIAADADREVRH